MPSVRVAISSFFTAEPLAEPMNFLFGLLGWQVAVDFAGFAQVFQTLLDPPDATHIVLARAEDIEVANFSDALLASTGNILVQVCAPHSEELEEALRANVASEPRISVLSGKELQHYYPVPQPLDPKAHALGAIPYTPEYFAALGAHLTRAIHRIHAAPCKVIALDCDDTLWRGVCGEDGPQAVVLDPSRRALQQFMQAQRASGRLLAIASKNNETDVIETFSEHPEFPLHLEDFTSRQVHWEPKAKGLESIAAELNLGLESIAFVDNDAKEVGEVAAELPGVIAIALPADDTQIPAFLDHIWAFDAPRTLTAEDLSRAQTYASETRRAAEARRARNLEEFLAGLELKITITAIDESEIARVAQLTQRTNQMNTSTRRRSESDIRAFLSDGSGFAVRVRDRLGDYGLVGVILLVERPEELVVESFMLSCRALGRGVEHQMLRRVGEIALERGLPSLLVEFQSTSKNIPARDFFYQITGRGETFRFPANLKLQTFRNRPEPVLTTRDLEAKAIGSGDYQRIAELRRPSDLMAAFKAENAGMVTVHSIYQAPRTDLERRLSSLWTELLGVPTIGLMDNFFDLGGHSLLAVQLVSRLHQDLAVDLPLEAVYTGSLTITELARSIELFQSGEGDNAEYTALLSEVENLSEEEVEALLAAEFKTRPA